MNLSPEQRTIATQRERIDELEEALRQAKVALTPEIIFPREWKLSPSQSRLLAALVSAPQGFLTYDSAARAVIAYAHETDDPLNIVMCQTCKMRARLRPHGIEILSRWGRGLELPPPSKAIIKAALERRIAA